MQTTPRNDGPSGPSQAATTTPVGEHAESLMRRAVAEGQSFLAKHRIQAKVAAVQTIPDATPVESSAPDLVVKSGDDSAESYMGGSVSPETPVMQVRLDDQAPVVADVSDQTDLFVLDVPSTEPEVEHKAIHKEPKAKSAKAAPVSPTGGAEEDFDADADIDAVEVDPEYAEIFEAQVEAQAMDAIKVASQGSSRDVSSSQRYLNQLSRYAPLDKEESYELFRKAKAGDNAAYEKLFNHNLRLVVSLVRPYLNRGMTFDDLVQEGGLGLMRGIQKFDPDVGVKPSTYLSVWIRQRLGRAVKDNMGIVRVPIHVHDNAAMIHAQAKRAREAGLPEAAALEKQSTEAYSKLISQAVPSGSLDQPIGSFDNEDARILSDMIVDESSDIETTVAHRQTIQLFFESAKELPPRSRFIVAVKCDLLEMYADQLDLETWIDENGLCDFVDTISSGERADVSLREIGNVLGISSERVNQIFRASMDTIKEEIGHGVGGLDNLSFDVENSPNGKSALKAKSN